MTRLLRPLFIALALMVVLAPSAFAQNEGRSPSDRVIFGGDETVAKGETVRDVFVFGGNVKMDGTAMRDVVVFGGNADISGPIGRDLVVFGGNASLTGDAHVGRNVVVGGGNVEFPPGKPPPVSGDITYGATPFRFFGPPSFSILNLLPSVVTSAILLLAALLALWFFPRQVYATAALIEQRAAVSFGLGCLALPTAIALGIICAITVILLPVTLAVAVVMAAAWLFGFAALFLVAGRFLLGAFNRPQDALPAVVLGAAIFLVLMLVPVLGALIGFIAGFVAVGSALGSRFGTRSADLPIFGGRPPAYAPTYPGYPGGYGYPAYPQHGYPPPPPAPQPSAPAPEPPSQPEPDAGPAPKPKRARRPKPTEPGEPPAPNA
jgi:hypothetical protein